MLTHSSGAEDRLHTSRANGSAASHAPRPEVGDEDEISLNDILDSLLAGKWILLATFFLVLTAAAVYTHRQPEVYESSSTLYVGGQQSSPQLTALLGGQGGGRNIANEIEIIKSRTVAMEVAERLLDLHYIPGTDEVFTVLRTGEGAPPPAPLTVAQRLRGRINVAQVGRGVEMIRLTAASTVPEEAALIANLYAEEFVEYTRMMSRSKMSASREFLGDVTVRFDSMLTATEQNLLQYSEEHGVLQPEQEAQQLFSQISGMQAQKYQALLEMRSAQAEREALEAELNRIRPGLAQAISSTDNQMIEGLRQRISRLQMEIEEVLSKNPDLRGREQENTDLMEKRQQIAELQEQLSERIARVTDQLLSEGELVGQSSSLEGMLSFVSSLQEQVVEKEVEMLGLQARLELLDEATQAYYSELNDIPYRSLALSRLQRELQTSEELFTGLFQKLQEARIAEQSEMGYVNVIDAAIVPGSPVRPLVRNNLLLGAVFGFILGVGLCFLRSAVNNRIQKPEDVRKHGYSVLGVVPDIRKTIKAEFDGRERITVGAREYSTNLLSILTPLSPASESYRRLRTNIQFSRPDKNLQVLLVTSPGPGEGKSTTSANLAITMAQAGRRTVYVDADLRRPTGHSLLGLPQAPGLIDALFEAQPVDMEQFATSIDDFYLIPVGNSVPNPAEVMGSRKMKEFIELLRQEFDSIIIDSPPVHAVADSILIANQCDGTVLVCSAGETSWVMLDRAVEALQGSGAKVLGVLLNRYDPRGDARGYGYGYYGSYGETPAARTPEWA